jgi:hypothetical protein
MWSGRNVPALWRSLPPPSSQSKDPLQADHDGKTDESNLERLKRDSDRFLVLSACLVTPTCSVDEDSGFLRNVGSFLPGQAASHPFDIACYSSSYFAAWWQSVERSAVYCHWSLVCSTHFVTAPPVEKTNGKCKFRSGKYPENGISY